MSRLPRHLEHLRTGFTAEAVAAATCRAFAGHAEGAGRPNLAARWLALAADKDKLAIELLHAAGKVETEGGNLREAIAEEQYENEVLYPRMIADMEHLGHPEEAALLGRLVATQRHHQAVLDDLRRELGSAPRDVRDAAVAKAG